MTGSDLQYFLSELLQDLLHLGDADILSLFFRLLIVSVVLVATTTIVKFLYRVFWDTFGGLLRWIGGILSSPYRVPKGWIQKEKAKKRQRKWEKERAREIAEYEARQVQQKQEAEERQIKEEKKALEILNSSPDLSRFKK